MSCYDVCTGRESRPLETYSLISCQYSIACRPAGDGEGREGREGIVERGGETHGYHHLRGTSISAHNLCRKGCHSPLKEHRQSPYSLT